MVRMLLIYLCFVLGVCCALNDIRNKREKFLEDEFKMTVGGNIKLDEEETQMNDLLVQWKHEEYDHWFENPDEFNFTKSFFEYKDYIQSSKVYKVIEKMPKGGLLHVHGTAILGPDFFVNITYRDNLFVCFEEASGIDNNWVKFQFALQTPTSLCNSSWQLISDVRKSVKDVKEFDQKLQRNFTFVETKNKDTKSNWNRFAPIFKVISPLICHRPVWEEFLYEALGKLRHDKIMYAELRLALLFLYELDGTTYDELYFVNLTKTITEKFKNDHSDYFGTKMIVSTGRHFKDQSMEERINATLKVKRLHPDFVAGFDLIGFEDGGAPLLDNLELFEEAKKELDYYFHAGETNWYGTFSDENLIDAVLLGSKRIGHGYAVLKHPLVLEEIKKTGVCVEVNVISNSVLGLTRDARTHPLGPLLAQGVTSVLSGDDPGLWGAPPSTADMYVAFLGVASRRHDLRLLKQLALNSIHCSALSNEQKKMAHTIFRAQWKKFVSDFMEYHSVSMV